LRDNGDGQPQARTAKVSLLFRVVALFAALSAFGQVALGGVVRVTDSGLGCPDWPLCHGQIIPPFELTTLIEYSHRLSASVLVALLLTVSILALIHYRSNRLILAPSIAAIAFAFAAAVLGGVTVLTELDWWVVLFHLGIAELVVASTVVISVVAWGDMLRSRDRAPQAGESGRFNLLVLATVIGVFLLILSGSYMVGYGAGSSCGTWPLCRGSLFPDGTPYAVHMGHRFLSVLVGGLIVWTAVSARSRRVLRPDLGWSGLGLVLLFAAQIAVGAGTVLGGFAAGMKALHLSLATLVWIAVVLLAALVYVPQRVEFMRLRSATTPASNLEGMAS